MICLLLFTFFFIPAVKSKLVAQDIENIKLTKRIKKLEEKLSLKRKTTPDPVDVAKKRKPEKIVNNDPNKVLNENMITESSSSLISPKRRKSTAIKFDESAKENSPLKPKISPFRGIENTFTGILKLTEKSLKQKRLNFASTNCRSKEEKNEDVELTFCEDLEKEQVNDVKPKNALEYDIPQYDEMPTTSERTRIADARRKQLHDAATSKTNVHETQKQIVIKEEKKSPKRVYQSCSLFSDTDSEHSFSSIVCLETPDEEIYSIDDQTNDAIECDLVSRLEEQFLKSKGSNSVLSPVLPYNNRNQNKNQPNEKSLLGPDECKECNEYYKYLVDNFGKTEAEKRKKNCTKHQNQRNFQNTPEGFWNPAFSDSII
ncbi:unnamed protein product [Diamesa serratosioi]